jgi:hypothetical protein
MPRTQITQANLPSTGPDRFPKFKLETNEVSIFNILQEPWSEYVHEHKAIRIENGVAKKRTITRKDKSTYEDFEYDFLGRPICLGLSDAIKQSGSDPANCPSCAAGNQPTLRYAVPVLKYSMAGGAPRVPFGGDVQLWGFTPNMFKELYNLSQGVPGQDLTKTDLRMVCEDGTWQRNKLYLNNPAEGPFCLRPENVEQARALLSQPGNLPTEEQLIDACGRKRSREQMEMDLAQIRQKKEQADRAGSQPGSLSANLDSLLPQGSGSQQGWAQMPQTQPAPAPSYQPVPAAVAPQGMQADPFSGQQPSYQPVPATAAPQGTRENPGVGGMEEFMPQPVPQGQDQAVAQQAQNLFPSAPAAAPQAPAPTAAPAGGAAPGGQAAPMTFDDILKKGRQG